MGFIPSRKGSSEKQYRLASKINGIRRVVVALSGGDKPHPYGGHRQPRIEDDWNYNLYLLKYNRGFFFIGEQCQ